MPGDIRYDLLGVTWITNFVINKGGEDTSAVKNIRIKISPLWKSIHYILLSKYRYQLMISIPYIYKLACTIYIWTATWEADTNIDISRSFHLINWYKAHHTSPVRVRYGASFVNSLSCPSCIFTLSSFMKYHVILDCDMSRVYGTSHIRSFPKIHGDISPESHILSIEGWIKD